MVPSIGKNAHENVGGGKRVPAPVRMGGGAALPIHCPPMREGCHRLLSFLQVEAQGSMNYGIYRS